MAFKLILAAGAIALLVAVAARRVRRQPRSATAALDDLNAAIDRSQLPERARAEMRALIAAGRLRPSQALDSDS